jgi:ABC transporter substrate binding protein
LKEAVPTIARVAVLVDPALAPLTRVPGNMAREAQALGVQLQRVEAGAPEAFEGIFAAMVQEGADALMIMATPLFARNRQRLLELALQHRLPTMAGERSFAEAGSLLTYGAFVRELCQRSAILVDKILKGAKPADLPVERAYKFYLKRQHQDRRGARSDALAGVPLPGGRGAPVGGCRGRRRRKIGVELDESRIPLTETAPNNRLQPTPYSLRFAAAFRRG